MVNTLKVKRPAIWAGTAFMAGIVAGVAAAKDGKIYEAVVAIIFMYMLCAVMGLMKKLNYILPVIAVSITISFFYSYFTYTQRYEKIDFTDEYYEIDANIYSYDKIYDNKVRYEIDHVFINGETFDTHMLLTVSNGKIYEIGDKISFQSAIYKPRQATNSKVFDYREYLADKNIYYVSYIDANDIINVVKYDDTSTKNFYYGFKRFQNSIIERYKPYLTNNAFGIVNAMISGDNIYMEENIYDLYRTTGTAHVLAISGLHVGFAALFASILTRKLKKNGIAYTIINLAVIWIYILFSGMNISAVRAGLFFTFVSFGKMLRQRCDITNIAFITATIMLAFNPLLLFSVSFQLSFSAVLAIALLSSVISAFINKKLSFVPKNYASAVSVMISAGVGVMLPIAYHYNTMSLVSLLVNLFIVPVYSFTVMWYCFRLD